MGELTIHELIWGYAGAMSVLGGFFVYCWKKRWPHMIWELWMKFLIFIHLIKKPGSIIDVHMRVKKLLIELRTETKADRAHIVQFHNGEYYDNNCSIKRFTYSYEDLKAGVSSNQEKYQRRLVSGYVDGLSKLVDNDNPINKLSIKDLSSCLYKGKMLEEGTVSQIGVPLRCKFSGIPRIIGYILLSYNTERSPERCAFNNLVDKGHFLDSDTDALKERYCKAKCKGCNFQRYIPQFEQALNAIK